MADSAISGIVKSALEGVGSIAGCDISVGSMITTPSGVSIIPLSKVAIGLATGGVDYSSAKSPYSNNFGGGGGTGVSVTPIAALAVDRDGGIRILTISESEEGMDKFADILGHAPEIINKIKKIIT